MTIFLTLIKIRSYKCCITIELIWMKELIVLKVIEVKNIWFVTIGFYIMDPDFKILFFFLFFFACVFFHNHLRIIGLQGKWEGIRLTPHYQFHPFHTHLRISRAITAESSTLVIISIRTRTENLSFPSASL